MANSGRRMGKSARPGRDPMLSALCHSLFAHLRAHRRPVAGCACAGAAGAIRRCGNASVPGLIVDMRYAGAHNFVGRRIDGYERPRCLLTGAAAAALAAVARDLAPRGVVLKIFDCYRPTRAVANFVRWARDLGDSAGKAEFYPAGRQAHAVPRRLYLAALRPFARLDRRSYARTRRRWARARHGHAV